MRLLAIALAAALPVLLVSCDGGAQAAPGRPALIDRAIAAAGGEARLASIKSLEARSRGQQLGSAYEVVMQRLLPDRYRHDVDVSDARLVQATDGKEIWATLDDYPIPVTPDEAVSLRESWRLVELSMLVPLKSTAGIELKEASADDGEILHVTYPEDPAARSTPRGPYSLVFDPKSSLLKRVEFETRIFGVNQERRARFEFSDYRNVDGMMVPFAARMAADDKLEMEERVQEVLINPAIAPERFRKPAPPADLVIKKRTTPEIAVALLEQHGDKPDATEADPVLRRYLDKYDLVRIGPTFRLQPFGEGELPAVGIPIAPPPATTRPTSRPTTRELPRIAVVPARTILTTMISGKDSASRPAAIERLLSRAREDGYEPDGPCKIVYWPADVLQLQLPVRPRKG
jgi:hypothetical protein